MDNEFIASSTFQGDEAVPHDDAHPAGLGSLEYAMEDCRTSLEAAAEICGVSADDIVQAAEWNSKSHDDGSRRT